MCNKYDVVVVGCGIIGAATAFELSKYDLKIGVIEKGNDVSLAGVFRLGTGLRG